MIDTPRKINREELMSEGRRERRRTGGKESLPAYGEGAETSSSGGGRAGGRVFTGAPRSNWSIAEKVRWGGPDSSTEGIHASKRQEGEDFEREKVNGKKKKKK